jgi:phosphate transport system protein
MLQELLSIFRASSPLQGMAENFQEMLTLSMGMITRAGDLYFSQTITPEERTSLQKQDVRVNKLQRKIRKQVIVHLSIAGNQQDLPYCLLLMNLVKDVERIGDYAKELADLINLSDEPMPDSELVAELKELRAGIEADYAVAVEVLKSGDRERAIELIECGRDTVDRAQQLIENFAYSDLKAGAVTMLVLAVRHYERIAAHVLNLLSSVVMPLHKLDYYDEKDIAKADKKLQK